MVPSSTIRLNNVTSVTEVTSFALATGVSSVTSLVYFLVMCGQERHLRLLWFSGLAAQSPVLSAVSSNTAIDILGDYPYIVVIVGEG